MKKMNTLFRIFLFFCLLPLLSACGAKEKKAEQTLNEFFDAIKAHDFDKAKALVTVETQAVLDVVIKEEQKYKEHNTKPQEIKIEILDKKIEADKASFTVRIFVGEAVKTQNIVLVYLESSETWLVECPKEQLVLLRYIVFYNNYDAILVIVNKQTHIIVREHEVKHTVKHTGTGKKKHKHKDK